VTFVAGAVLVHVARRDAAIVPPWLVRLGAGLTALGLGTLLTTVDGVAASIASIACSIVAIVLIVHVLRAQYRR